MTLARLTPHEREFPLVIDSTMLSSMTCHRRWVWSYEANYTPFAGKSIDLMAGAAFAKGAEIMRTCFLLGSAEMTSISGAHLSFTTRPGDPEDALEAGVEALIQAYDQNTPAFNSPKTCDRMAGALEYYSTQFPLTDPEYGVISSIAGKPGVEWNFCVPLPVLHPDTGEPLLFAGRTDICLEIFGGRYLTDDKTTTRLGDSWVKQWDMRGQFAGYTWAARQLGIQIDGTLVRGTSILKSKYECKQALVDQPQWKCDEWLAATVAKLEMAKLYYYEHSLDGNPRPTVIPAFGEPCNEYGGCEFKRFCMVKDHAGWLEDNCAERNWDPLDRH